MQINLLGAVKEVTGSRTLLTMPNGLKILVDFGMVQGNLGNLEETLKNNGREFEFDVSEISYLVLTHGHIDHTGLVPLLIKRGFNGKIISTSPTSEFCALSFPDSAKIMQSDCDYVNKRRPKNKLKPLFTEEEGERAIDYIQCYDYNTEIVLDNNTTLELLGAGHMLGACMPRFTYKDGKVEKKILFTGDTSAKSGIHPFIRKADDIGDVDYIVCESTYGDRVHEEIDRYEILRKSVQEVCVDRGKTLVIPVFALQRSSELLWLLREVYLDNTDFYKIPIYLDTPMGIKAQRIMDNNREYWGDQWLERDEMLGNIFDWEVIEYISDHQSSLQLDNKDPKIILSSSGMCSGGRILNHLQNFLPHMNNKVLFTGYQAEGTLGNRILSTERKSVSISRSQVILRADIEQMSFSSHADKNQLVEFIKGTSDRKKLKKVILNHGEEKATISFKEELDRHLKGVDVIIPTCDRTIKL